MAEETEPDKGGEAIRLVLSSQVWNYLGWLARNTVLGKDEKEVAKQVLTDRLAEMRQEDYRDGQKQ
jgi:hypothetical protein